MRATFDRQLRRIFVAFAALALLAGPIGLTAAVKLPALIGDHMVVQQGKPFTVWGWAGKGEAVTVLFNGQERRVVAGADGTWRVVFDPLEAGGAPLEMTLRGAEGPAVVVKDILVGEVWVCSGQSNMEWPMSALPNPAPEILRADNPNMRLFLVPKRTADRPVDDVAAKWKLCDPHTVRPFSAVAYYFGLELHRRLGIPIGLIESAWGGTLIEPWTPPVGFAAVPEVKPILERHATEYAGYLDALARVLPAWETWARASRKALAAKPPAPPDPAPGRPRDPYDSPQTPTALYNGMIHPLTPFAIRGAIWYQGESNRNDGLLYEMKMRALIEGWRLAWKIGDFPFYFVQLAPYNYAYNRETPAGDVPDFLRLPLIWEAQTRTLRVPNTGLAVTTDIADLGNIHPASKREVGYRLSLWARAYAYAERSLVFSGPLYRSMTADGSLARIAFDHIGSGLVSNDGQPLKWFEIAGEDRVFYKAEAEIAGDTVVVWSPRVAAPKAVRFGWHQLAVPNLANKEGLPASPFRTDNW
ncbi:MAG: 9-O-acetylesterase, partial [Candidatus Aminicenantes bacterium]|nr:9-O-acetylesterase [Candidatus Aminicenantes bacterium]